MLLQRLADQVSTAIKPISWQALDEPKKTPVAKAKEPDKPRIPLASPIRTDLEVFRF